VPDLISILFSLFFIPVGFPKPCRKREYNEINNKVFVIIINHLRKKRHRDISARNFAF